MGRIVCATRGGAGSREAQSRAIRYGKDRGVPVVFLLVVDAASFGEVEPVLAEAIAAELRWIGRALLELARRRAEDAGVVAETVIREGAALAEIVAFVAASDAECLLVGAPRGSSVDVVGDDAVERFAADVAAETGVTAEVVYPA